MWKRGQVKASPSPTYIRLNLLPLTPVPLSGTPQGTWKRLSAPLFLLMRFSCLSKRCLGTAPAWTTNLSLTITVCGLYLCECVHVKVKLSVHPSPMNCTSWIIRIWFKADVYIENWLPIMYFTIHLLIDVFSSFVYTCLCPPSSRKGLHLLVSL